MGDAYAPRASWNYAIRNNGSTRIGLAGKVYVDVLTAGLEDGQRIKLEVTLMEKENPFREQTLYHFRVDGYDWAVTGQEDGYIFIEETRKNGQEDTHMYLELVKDDDGEWGLDPDDIHAGRQVKEYASESTVQRLIDFFNTYGAPGE